jgi:hypothetical protein
VELAWLVDYLMAAEHPAKPAPWRYRAADLAATLAAWRADGDEDALYLRVAGAAAAAREGLPVPGLEPRHDAPWSNGGGGPAPAPARALEATAEVAGAIAEGWVRDHPAGPSPQRLVVWFRVERAGPERWRIADSGARPTSHSARRRPAAVPPG